jgi:hypothetical protein
LLLQKWLIILNKGLITLSVAWALTLNAEDRIAVMGGWGMDDSLIQSKDIASASAIGLGWQIDLQAEWHHPWFGYGQFLMVSEWHRLKGDHLGEQYDLNLYAVKPTLRFYAEPNFGNRFFYEAALGVAYLDQRAFESIRLPTHLNFAIHFAAGWHWDEARRWDVSLRYNHYSNGYLSHPNPGLDFASLVLSYQF